MEPDFSGWVTKAGLRCADGRTIMPDAFKHQDNVEVPLVWQHGHKDVENVLGRVLLENRAGEGVYGYAFFNDTDKAKHAKKMVQHDDVKMMSIWANGLVEKAKQVFHGVIREVSLVLSGANPGAVIENVTIRHSDGDLEDLDDEVIIHTGIPFDNGDSGRGNNDDDDDEVNVELASIRAELEALKHATGDDRTIQDIFDSLSDEQKSLVYYLVGNALPDAADNSLQQDALGGTGMDDDEKGKGDMKVKHNVFESGDGTGTQKERHVLSHDAITGIVEQAEDLGSLKKAVEQYALAHGIEDIDILFPEARSIQDTPELLARRVEWVNQLLTAVRKTPFSRVRTMSADLTVQEARAKGYIKGNLKKEEFFRVSKRVTNPTTIYKKQKLDRDDIIDITDFDVVMWLKAEMRLMLDEEIARAVLVGDGRQPDDEDKVNEESIRPIANDHELYTTTVYVNIDDANSDFNEIVDAFTRERSKLRGTGVPNMYTTETYLAQAFTKRDTLGRRIYNNIADLKDAMRVNDIVSVEVLEEYDDIVAIFVNPVDYNIGADRGGNVSMFDDFDIDYNQYKYLIETRISGALVRLKSALVMRKVVGTDTLITPNEPAFDGTAVTITDQANVTYRNADTDAIMNAAGSPYAVAPGDTLNVVAEAANGYYFEDTDVDDWSFTNEV